MFEMISWRGDCTFRRTLYRVAPSSMLATRDATDGREVTPGRGCVTSQHMTLREISTSARVRPRTKANSPPGGKITKTSDGLIGRRFAMTIKGCVQDIRHHLHARYIEYTPLRRSVRPDFRANALRGNNGDGNYALRELRTHRGDKMSRPVKQTTRWEDEKDGGPRRGPGGVGGEGEQDASEQREGRRAHTSQKRPVRRVPTYRRPSRIYVARAFRPSSSTTTSSWGSAFCRLQASPLRRSPSTVLPVSRVVLAVPLAFSVAPSLCTPPLAVQCHRRLLR